MKFLITLLLTLFASNAFSYGGEYWKHRLHYINLYGSIENTPPYYQRQLEMHRINHLNNAYWNDPEGSIFNSDSLTPPNYDIFQGYIPGTNHLAAGRGPNSREFKYNISTTDDPELMELHAKENVKRLEFHVPTFRTQINDTIHWGMKFRAHDLSQYSGWVNITQIKGDRLVYADDYDAPSFLITLKTNGELGVRATFGGAHHDSVLRTTGRYFTAGRVQAHKKYDLDIAFKRSNNNKGFVSIKITNTEDPSDVQISQITNLSAGYDNLDHTVLKYGLYQNRESEVIEKKFDIGGARHNLITENIDILSDHTFISNEGTGTPSLNRSTTKRGALGQAHRDGWRGQGSTVIHGKSNTNINTIADESTIYHIPQFGNNSAVVRNIDNSANVLHFRPEYRDTSIQTSNNLDVINNQELIGASEQNAARAAIVWSKFDTLSSKQLKEVLVRTSTNNRLNLGRALSPVGNLN